MQKYSLFIIIYCLLSPGCTALITEDLKKEAEKNQKQISENCKSKVEVTYIQGCDEKIIFKCGDFDLKKSLNN